MYETNQEHSSYTSVVPCAFAIESGDAQGMSALNADPRQLLSYLHVICIHSSTVVVNSIMYAQQLLYVA